MAVGQNTNFGTDIVIDVENVVGGAGGDDIFGSSAANVLAGGAGGDVLQGRGGNDTLLGGAGVDEIVYELGDGVDIVDGGEGDEGSGDRLVIGSGTGNPDNDYIRIAAGLDADANLDIDWDADSNVEVPADGIELDVVDVENVLVFSGAGNDNVVISGDVLACSRCRGRSFVFGGEEGTAMTPSMPARANSGRRSGRISWSRLRMRATRSTRRSRRWPMAASSVTWQSDDNGANSDIRGQVFAADGTPINGSDFLVSTSNANDQFKPQITALANGGFAVTWHSFDNGMN